MLADSEGPDQSAHMPEYTFSHGAADTVQNQSVRLIPLQYMVSQVTCNPIKIGRNKFLKKKENQLLSEVHDPLYMAYRFSRKSLCYAMLCYNYPAALNIRKLGKIFIIELFFASVQPRVEKNQTFGKFID